MEKLSFVSKVTLTTCLPQTWPIHSCPEPSPWHPSWVRCSSPLKSAQALQACNMVGFHTTINNIYRLITEAVHLGLLFVFPSSQVEAVTPLSKGFFLVAQLADEAPTSRARLVLQQWCNPRQSTQPCMELWWKQALGKKRLGLASAKGKLCNHVFWHSFSPILLMKTYKPFFGITGPKPNTSTEVK